MFRWLQDMCSGRMQFFRWVKVMCRKKALYLLRHPMKLFWRMIVFIVVVFNAIVILTKLYCWGEAGYTALGSLFTALAFAGMIATVLLQRIELKEQRKELHAQRQELEGQKEELKIQNRTAQLQRFENSFFHLLDNFRKTVAAMRAESVPYKGHSSYTDVSIAFRATIISRMIYYQKWSKKEIFLDINNEVTSLPESCKKFFYEYYLIVHFILNHAAFAANKSEVNNYLAMLNTVLGPGEYFLLFYNSIADSDRRYLINQYALFENYILLNSKYSPCEPWHILFFEPSAFGPDYEEYIKTSNLKGKTLADFLPQEQTENS